MYVLLCWHMYIYGCVYMCVFVRVNIFEIKGKSKQSGTVVCVVWDLTYVSQITNQWRKKQQM